MSSLRHPIDVFFAQPLRVCVALYCLFLVIQLVFLYAISLPIPPIGDVNYLINTHNIFHGVYTDTFKPPLYSFFLLIPLTFSDSAFSIYVFQIFVFAFSPVLTYLLCKKLRFPNMMIAFIILIEICYPYYTLAFTQLIETGFAILFMKGVLLAYLSTQKKYFVFVILFGFLFGMFTLLRPNIYSIIPVFLIIDYYRLGSLPTIKKYLLFALGVFIAILPWAVHTYNINGHVSLTPTNAGYNMVISYNHLSLQYLSEYGHLSLEDTVRDHSELASIHESMTQYEQSFTLTQRARNYLSQNLSEIPSLVLLKIKRYWDYRLEANHPLHVHLAYSIPFLMLMFLSILGIYYAYKNREPFISFLIGVALFYMIPFIVFFPTVRMRMPSEFILFIFAGYALYTWCNKKTSS